MREAIPFFTQHGARGVVLDVRFNSGGDDHIGMTVASLFFEQRALGFSKRSRLPMAEYAGPDEPLAWTDFSIDSVFVGGGPSELTFTGPVCVCPARRQGFSLPLCLSVSLPLWALSKMAVVAVLC